jgi:hypothetical protein
MQRGKIVNRQYAAQLRNFSGLLFGKNNTITPTDIDGLIEYENKGFIFIEAKYGKTDIPYGQKLALQRLVDNLKKQSILFVARHNSDGDIDMANAIVTEYYYQGGWREFDRPFTLKQCIDAFIDRLNKS